MLFGVNISASLFCSAFTWTIFNIIVSDRHKILTAKLTFFNCIAIFNNHFKHVCQENAEIRSNNCFLLRSRNIFCKLLKSSMEAGCRSPSSVPWSGCRCGMLCWCLSVAPPCTESIVLVMWSANVSVRLKHRFSLLCYSTLSHHQHLHILYKSKS